LKFLNAGTTTFNPSGGGIYILPAFSGQFIIGWMVLNLNPIPFQSEPAEKRTSKSTTQPGISP